MEIWKDIKGYEDFYEVSSYGNVRDKKTNTILKGDTNSVGYRRVTLYVPVKRRFFIHRLVALTFMGEFADLVINHKDGNKTNNDYDNLYVCKDKAEHGAVHDSLEKVAFELYKRGLIRFNEETGEYYLNEQIRTEG